MAQDLQAVRVKRGLSEQFFGGVIMDVVNPEQAKIAADAGGCCCKVGWRTANTPFFVAWPALWPSLLRYSGRPG